MAAIPFQHALGPVRSLAESVRREFADPAARGRRVCLLLAPIALLSLADLWMTIDHLTQVGMFESNPIARAVMAQGSPTLLAVWKILSVAMAIGFLFVARRKWIGEAATWLAVFVLIWLMIRWAVYSDQVSTFNANSLAYIEQIDTNWVRMPTGP